MRTVLALLLLTLAAAALAASVQTGTCDVAQDAIDSRRYVLSGAACPVPGVLVVYTHLGVDGAGQPIPPHEAVFTMGIQKAGDKLGLYWPKGVGQ